MTTNGQTAKTKNTIFQLTHPRGGRLDGNFVSVTVDRVSIHAPARDATFIPPSFVRSLPLFQFTHLRGVRRAYRRRQPRGVAFQFTHPRGVRPRIRRRALALVVVSIHTPARGVTLPSGLHCVDVEAVSIHAPARGATPIGTSAAVRPSGFQFTHPRGVRRPTVSPAGYAPSFNSRTREGCDLCVRAVGAL